MKPLTSRQLFTYMALFLLLFGRIFAEDIVANIPPTFNTLVVPPSWVLEVKSAQNWIYHLFFNWSFLLVAIVIIINRSDLDRMNIDEAFVALLIAGGVIYWAYYRWPSGWVVLLVPFALYILHRKHEFKFVKIEPIAGRITLALVVGFLLGLLLLRHDLLTIRNILSVTHSVAIQFPFTLIEEFIFRGLLWKFLADLSWSVPKIVGLQAFLFWFSHSRYLLTDPIYFWITIPLASIVLGVVVWRTRSITVSLLAHLFYNFLS